MTKFHKWCSDLFLKRIGIDRIGYDCQTWLEWGASALWGTCTCFVTCSPAVCTKNWVSYVRIVWLPQGAVKLLFIYVSSACELCILVHSQTYFIEWPPFVVTIISMSRFRNTNWFLTSIWHFCMFYLMQCGVQCLLCLPCLVRLLWQRQRGPSRPCQVRTLQAFIYSAFSIFLQNLNFL